MPSTGLVPNVGESKMLQGIINAADPENLVLRLYKNDVTPGSTMTLADYTEATFTGYASVTLSSGDWVITSPYPAMAAYSSGVPFTCAATTSETIYGFYLTEVNSSTLMWSERFDAAPRMMTYPNDALTIKPRIQLVAAGQIEDQENLWLLNEASGTRADSWGLSLDLTDNNSVGSVSDGGELVALFDPASSEYLSRAANGTELYPQGDYTFSIWFYPTGVTSNAYTLIAKNSASSIDRPFFARWFGNAFKLVSVSVTSSTGAAIGASSSLLSFPPNEWHHLAFGYSTADKKCRVWANGSDVVESSAFIGAGPPTTGSCPFLIGAQNGAGTRSDFFEGRIKKVRLFSRLLTTDEVRLLARPITSSAARTNFRIVQENGAAILQEVGSTGGGFKQETA